MPNFYSLSDELAKYIAVNLPEQHPLRQLDHPEYLTKIEYWDQLIPQQYVSQFQKFCEHYHISIHFGFLFSQLFALPVEFREAFLPHREPQATEQPDPIWPMLILVGDPNLSKLAIEYFHITHASRFGAYGISALAAAALSLRNNLSAYTNYQFVESCLKTKPWVLDNDRRNCLHYAALSGSSLLVQAMTDHMQHRQVEFFSSASLSIRDTDKNARSVFHYAVLSGSTELVDYLVNRGVDVHQVANDGMTASHFAFMSSSLEQLNKIVELDIFVNEPDRYGRYPVDFIDKQLAGGEFIAKAAEINQQFPRRQNLCP